MKELTKEERTIRLTNREHAQLLKRFDLNNAKQYFTQWKIDVPCICSMGNQRDSCSVCPLNCGSEGNCGRLLNELLGPKWYLCLIESWITWPLASNEKAREQITTIHNALLEFQTVGMMDEKLKECPTCKGKGTVPTGSSSFDGAPVTCINCKGTGLVEKTEEDD